MVLLAAYETFPIYKKLDAPSLNGHRGDGVFAVLLRARLRGGITVVCPHIQQHIAAVYVPYPLRNFLQSRF